MAPREQLVDEPICNDESPISHARATLAERDVQAANPVLKILLVVPTVYCQCNSISVFREFLEAVLHEEACMEHAVAAARDDGA